MAKRKIKLLSTVALNEDLPGRKLKRGEVRTIVEVLAMDVYELEFCDEDGQTYAEIALLATNIRLAQSGRIVENRCEIAHAYEVSLPAIFSPGCHLCRQDLERH